MSLQVTGYFEHPFTKQLFKNPHLALNPILAYKGNLNMEVIVNSENGSGVITYFNIDKSSLIYTGSSTDPYVIMINTLENFLIDQLSGNPDYTITKVITIVPTPEPTVEPTPSPEPTIEPTPDSTPEGI